MTFFELDINYDGSRMAFTSRLPLSPRPTNGAQEIYSKRLGTTLARVTNSPAGVRNYGPRFGGFATLLFLSNGDPVGANADRNTEVFIADFLSAGDLSPTVRQVTDTVGGEDNYAEANSQAVVGTDGSSIVF